MPTAVGLPEKKIFEHELRFAGGKWSGASQARYLRIDALGWTYVEQGELQMAEDELEAGLRIVRGVPGADGIDLYTRPRVEGTALSCAE